MITGIYTILPIQGIVSIFSTQISPLSTSKPIEVYATTSHPIPIIEPATSPSDVPIQSPFLQQLHLPWSYLIGSEQTICLIRENKCGLETIRAGAVPGFTNMLPEGSDNWGLKNFKPVSASGAESKARAAADNPYEGLRLVSNVDISICNIAIMVALAELAPTRKERGRASLSAAHRGSGERPQEER
jgi:hypothetical protein